MPIDFRYDVFLSRSSKSEAVVRPLAERLRAKAAVVKNHALARTPANCNNAPHALAHRQRCAAPARDAVVTE